MAENTPGVYVRGPCGCCSGCCCVPGHLIVDTLLLSFPDGPPLLLPGGGPLPVAGPVPLYKRRTYTDGDGCTVRLWKGSASIPDTDPGFECNTATYGFEFETRDCPPAVFGVAKTLCTVFVSGGANGQAFRDSSVDSEASDNPGVEDLPVAGAAVLSSCNTCGADGSSVDIAGAGQLLIAVGCQDGDCVRLSAVPLHLVYPITGVTIHVTAAAHAAPPPFAVTMARVDNQGFGGCNPTFVGVTTGAVLPVTWVIDWGDGITNTWPIHADALIGVKQSYAADPCPPPFPTHDYTVTWSATDATGATFSGVIAFTLLGCTEVACLEPREC